MSSLIVGAINVATTSDGGHPPEYYAEYLCDRLLVISETAPPEIKLQAQAFREQVRGAALEVIRQAILSDHTTVIAHLRRAGMDDAAQLVYELRR